MVRNKSYTNSFPCYHFLNLLFLGTLYSTGCQDRGLPDRPDGWVGGEGIDYFLPHIDLNHWKVTLPIGNPSTEIEPPEILNYATNETLRPFMYNDSTDGSLVFYTYPGSTTPNSSYSRTELREQMEPGSNSINWKFSQGGKLIGTLSVPDISKDKNGKPHRTIVMQIHGRLTNSQKQLIGQKDNNAPPVLKIYWDNGRVRVKTKELKNVNISEKEILHKDAWKDDSGKYFNAYVGTEIFKLEVNAYKGGMSVRLNDNETFTYENVHMEKWEVFENYFKAGNYLQIKDQGSYAYVKYYSLIMSH